MVVTVSVVNPNVGVPQDASQIKPVTGLQSRALRRAIGRREGSEGSDDPQERGFLKKALEEHKATKKVREKESLQGQDQNPSEQPASRIDVAAATTALNEDDEKIQDLNTESTADERYRRRLKEKMDDWKRGYCRTKLEIPYDAHWRSSF
ncbi:hypothetical protein FISHEDRAFT_60344 [Fistulina hepatica ATCC 64428]|uniref:Uncharacterized protein n=1 Tax=Fistulina hepatica ATCC 64428 TaxID=1128425 RepID=A0A0D7A620_9AGAR|nr:hypothetical protein FISHEDRAFT_60344 [Fistulina hepatica ATCC 64428]